VRAHAGSRSGGAWKRLPYVAVASGNDARRPFEDGPAGSSLAWITAGLPTQSTTVDDTWLSFMPRVGGTVGVNRQVCTPARTHIPLSGKGLGRASVSPSISGVACPVSRRVIVRIRAVVDGGTALRERPADSAPPALRRASRSWRWHTRRSSDRVRRDVGRWARESVQCSRVQVGLTRYPKARERPGGRSRPAVLYFAASAAAPRS
jgi:hypothetical protein